MTRPAFPARLPGRVASTAPSTRASVSPIDLTPASGLGLDSDRVRARMVQLLSQQGLADAAVLAAMQRVERHRFVDSALANRAYEDTALPIGLGQTISKPSVVARMLSLLRGAAIPLTRVLEVGTGCGYQAALLSLLAQEVYSIERLRDLHERARTNLRALQLANLHLLLGDGMLGYASGAPYAGILAAACGPEVPQSWIDQLAPGGRLVAPLEATRTGVQTLLVLDQTEHGPRVQRLEAVHFVPLKSGIA